MSPPRAPAVSNPGPRSQSSVSSFGECGGVSTALRPRVWTGASRPFHLVVRRRSARGARWLSPGAETRASCRLPPRGGSRRKRWGVDATPALRRLPRARSALALWLHRSTRTRSSTRRAQTRSRAARTCPGTREPPEFEGTRGRPDSGRRLRFPPAVPAAAPGCRRRNAPSRGRGRGPGRLLAASLGWLGRRPLLARDLAFPAPPRGFSAAGSGRSGDVATQLDGLGEVGGGRRAGGGAVPGAPSCSRPAHAARCPRAARAHVSTAKTVACPCGRDVAGATHAGSRRPPPQVT